VTYLEAAEQILRAESPGAPMHYRKLTELAIERGLIEPRGLTPEATMVAQISQHIKKREAAGRAAQFRSFGRGLYGLTAPTDPLGGSIDSHNEKIRGRLRDALATMDPRAFEHLIASLLAALGFEDIEVTNYSGDRGIDVRATRTLGGVTDVKTAVQVKRWSGNVPGKIVNQLRGSLDPDERGLIITLSTFTRDATVEATAPARPPITLIDGQKLLDLLIDNEIGVTSRPASILELDEAGVSLTDDESPEGPDAPTAEQLRPAGHYSGSKALSCWPLPGGRLAWKETLDAMLRHVVASAPTVSQMASWIIDTFEKVSSPKVARGYIASVLRPFNLVETQGERLVLTATGVEYLDDPTPAALTEIARLNVAGFDEILDALSEGPKSSAQLLELLQTQLHVGWETDAQVRFRLIWLENLGLVKESDGTWQRVH
jgi:Restriction endonuclease/HB1, ASXL, restriction endonuclease HTH domain